MKIVLMQKQGKQSHPYKGAHGLPSPEIHVHILKEEMKH